MSLPKEPRQAMINMMYLVLTALLAINVSAEVLNAFTLVEHSMTRTNRAMSKNLGMVYSAFQERSNNDPSSKDLWDKAKKVRAIADSAYNEIEAMKVTFLESAKVPYRTLEDGTVAETYFSDEDSTLFVDEGSARNTHATTIYFDPEPGLGSHPSKESQGEVLRGIMSRVKDTLFSTEFFELQDTAIMNRLDAGSPLATLDGKAYESSKGEEKITWTYKFFHEVPMAGALAILSNIQNNIRTAEADVIDYLKSKVGVDFVNFDELRGQVISSKGYYQQGEPVEADIFVAASSSSQRPVVYIGSLKPVCKEKGVIRNEISGEEVGNVPPVNSPRKIEADEGMSSALYKTSASGVGEQSITGVIEVKNDKTGSITYHPFEYKYTVGKSSLAVSPVNMSVVYAGIDNPMDVVVSGFPDSKLRVSTTNGKISKNGSTGSRYTLRPVYNGKNSKCIINVNIDDPGVKGPLKSQIFDVKPLPAGNGTVATFKTGPITTAQARSVVQLRGKLTAAPEGFLFKVDYDVIGWSVLPVINGQQQPLITGRGDVLNREALDLIEKARPGANFNITIEYKSPDGRKRSDIVGLTKTR